MLLAGDIGGTNTRLALFDPAGDWVARDERIYPSREHASLDELVRDFVAAQRARPTHACFAVAGPVQDGRAQITNLPWVVEATALSRFLGVPVWVINDLEANAWGVATLGPGDTAEIQPGDPTASGNGAVVAAGTGLGTAGLYWDGTIHRPFAAEGGHATFAPGDALERELGEWLTARLGGHVSWERVVSGPGLVTLYDFLLARSHGSEPSWLRDARSDGDAAAAISQAALEGRCSIAADALDRFVQLYGAVAGNVALTLLSSGGVWIGGGIAPRILAKLRDGTFRRRFVAKGRMQRLLEAMPVRVILHDATALRGAGRCAATRAAASPARA